MSIIDIAELKIPIGPPIELANEYEKYKAWKSHVVASLQSAKKADLISYNAFIVRSSSMLNE